MGTLTVEAKNGARNISGGKDRENKSIFTFGKDSQVALTMSIGQKKFHQ